MLKLKPIEVKEGDLLDLEDDKYADPNGNDLYFPCELVLVSANAIQETDGCVLVKTEVDWYGFPNDHVLSVKRESEEIT
jgi:hypothetical protein